MFAPRKKPERCNSLRLYRQQYLTDLVEASGQTPLHRTLYATVSFCPHHRFAVPLPRSRRGGLVTRRFLAESRNISFPRRCGGSGERSEPIGAPMPHAAIPFRPHHRFAVPLPRSRRGGLVTLCFFAESRNISFPRRCGGAVNVCQSHFVLLVFLGRFPIRPVSRSAVPYGLASRTGQ